MAVEIVTEGYIYPMPSGAPLNPSELAAKWTKAEAKEFLASYRVDDPDCRITLKDFLDEAEDSIVFEDYVMEVVYMDLLSPVNVRNYFLWVAERIGW